MNHMEFDPLYQSSNCEQLRPSGRVTILGRAAICISILFDIAPYCLGDPCWYGSSGICPRKVSSSSLKLVSDVGDESSSVNFRRFEGKLLYSLAPCTRNCLLWSLANGALCISSLGTLSIIPPDRFIEA